MVTRQLLALFFWVLLLTVAASQSWGQNKEGAFEEKLNRVITNQLPFFESYQIQTSVNKFMLRLDHNSFTPRGYPGFNLLNDFYFLPENKKSQLIELGFELMARFAKNLKFDDLPSVVEEIDEILNNKEMDALRGVLFRMQLAQSGIAKILLDRDDPISRVMDLSQDERDTIRHRSHELRFELQEEVEELHRKYFHLIVEKLGDERRDALLALYDKGNDTLIPSIDRMMLGFGYPNISLDDEDE